VNIDPAHDLKSQERDGLVLGVELVLSTTIFAFLGWLLDGALGTMPVFTVLLGGFTCGYTVWRIVTGYDARMAEHQASRNPLRQGPAE
jgi:F0F1-type ATP synthase assembly protein I